MWEVSVTVTALLGWISKKHLLAVIMTLTASLLFFSSRILGDFAGHLLHPRWVPDCLQSDCHSAVLKRKGTFCVADVQQHNTYWLDTRDLAAKYCIVVILLAPLKIHRTFSRWKWAGTVLGKVTKRPNTGCVCTRGHRWLQSRQRRPINQKSRQQQTHLTWLTSQFMTAALQ